MHKNDFAYISHILTCIKKIKKYSKGQSKLQFKESELLQDAIIRNIEIIGEASKKISPSFKKDYSHIPWKEISGMRDKQIHDCFNSYINILEQNLSTLKPLSKRYSLNILVP